MSEFIKQIQVGTVTYDIHDPKLDGTVGSSTKGIYLNNGAITATTYAVGKTVPSDAKFTDTVTTIASTTGSGNAVTGITASNGALTVTKGTTFATKTELDAEATLRKDTDDALEAYIKDLDRVVAAEAEERAGADDRIIGMVETEATNRADADYALSTRIDNLESRGRFLSTWDASTGKPSDLPATIATTAYTYKTGDYFVVKTAGTKHPSVPSGNTLPAGTTLESWTYFVTGSDLSINDSIYFTGSAWQILHTPVSQTTWGTIGGTLANQTDLNTALSGKVNNGTTTSTNGSHTHTTSGTAASAGGHTHSVTATGSISVTASTTGNYQPSGSVANHSHSIGAASTTTVNTGYTHTPASLTGTTSFNVDAIKSAVLTQYDATATGRIPLIIGGSTTSVLTGVKVSATTAAYTSVKTSQTVVTGVTAASLTGTTTFNTDAYKAVVNGTTLELVPASTASVGISGGTSSGTVSVPMTFNTTTVATGVGANGTANAYTGLTTKYFSVVTDAASKGTVTISGGSIASAGTTTVVTAIPTNTGNSQPTFTGTTVQVSFTGTSANTNSAGAHTHSVTGTAASNGDHTHTVG